MFRLPNVNLDTKHQEGLDLWQKEVDLAGTYAQQVAMAKSKFVSKNRIGNSTFDHIKDKLTEMCCGHRRCAYCEDSAADEVEHIHPKDLFPESVFHWQNYVYACGPCNGPKNNRFAVILPTGRCRNITRTRGNPVVCPPPGQPMLINPRMEDPIDLLFLDISNTFFFLPRINLSRNETLRARYTIHILRLNIRDHVVKGRANAYRNYYTRLDSYVRGRDNGQDVSAYQAEIKCMDHRTVWLEMIRQRSQHAKIKSLFESAPEALNW